MAHRVLCLWPYSGCVRGIVLSFFAAAAAAAGADAVQ